MIRYITPAVTPLTEDGQIDVQAVHDLYHFLINKGVDGILVLGSIGEFFAFTMEEKKTLIQAAVAAVDHRVPLIVGTGSTVRADVVDLSRFALEAGADAVMIVPPYYFALTDRDVFEWFDGLAQEIPGRVYLYNFPDRTGYSIAPSVVAALAEKHSNIIGIKDTIGGMDHTREVIKAVKKIRPDFEVYSGFDDNFSHNVLSGGNGCVAGLSNIVPEITHALAEAARNGDFAGMQKGQLQIDRLMDVYTVGAPFVPFVKAAVGLRGVPVSSKVTQPLPTPTEEQLEALRRILAKEITL